MPRRSFSLWYWFEQLYWSLRPGGKPKPRGQAAARGSRPPAGKSGNRPAPASKGGMPARQAAGAKPVSGTKPAVGGKQAPAAKPAPAAKQAAVADRRPAAKFSCNLDTSCQAISAMRDDPWPAKVKEVSPGTVGLLLGRRFEPGTLLTFEVQSASQTFSRTLLARVTRATSQGSGRWSLDCALASKLNDDELQALLS